MLNRSVFVYQAAVLAVFAAAAQAQVVAPTNLTASAAGSTQINLQWNPSTSPNPTYYVEQCMGSCTWYATVGIVQSTSYAPSGLLPSTTYWFRVRAFSGNILSAYTNVASATTLASGAVTVTTPAAPSNLTATSSANQINLVWADNSNNRDRIPRGALHRHVYLVRGDRAVAGRHHFVCRRRAPHLDHVLVSRTGRRRHAIFGLLEYSPGDYRQQHDDADTLPCHAQQFERIRGLFHANQPDLDR